MWGWYDLWHYMSGNLSWGDWGIVLMIALLPHIFLFPRRTVMFLFER